MPKGEGPHPAVVLVHGSGPNDRDETIGPNKPFRDIAHGLASRGIAVLRYDKRTRVHGQRILQLGTAFTVKEESVDDAVAAVELLKETERIDSDRVYVLGHSLGGMVIPRIAAEKPGARGYIILAGATRPLEDLMLEQVTYIAELDGEISEEEKEGIREIEKGIEKIRALDPEKPKGTRKDLLGALPPYWLDLRGYDPAEQAKAMEEPILILQGERDYQVTLVDFDNWKKAVGEKENVTLKSYPALNHLFMAGKGKSKPAEYQIPANVSEEVILDVTAFVGTSTK
jgi:dienelactone hydrolase